MGQAQDKFFCLLFDLNIDFNNQKFPWLTSQVLPDGPEMNTVLWKIFLSLGGSPDAMRSKRPQRLSPDGYLPGLNCLIEFDELQHFTEHRKTTLDHYPAAIPLGFDLGNYRTWCGVHADRAFRKGPPGYRKPKKEFPFDGGRVAQRALFDAYRDLLPPSHGLAPTIRVSEFQIPSLKLNAEQARRELSGILSQFG